VGYLGKAEKGIRGGLPGVKKKGVKDLKGDHQPHRSLRERRAGVLAVEETKIPRK